MKKKTATVLISYTPVGLGFDVKGMKGKIVNRMERRAYELSFWGDAVRVWFTRKEVRL